MTETDSSFASLLEAEKEFETDAIKEATHRYREKLKEARNGGDVALFHPEMKLLVDNVPLISEAIRKDLIGKGPVKGFKRKAYGEIHPDELAVLTIRHCLNHYLGEKPIQTIAAALADDIRVHKDDRRFDNDFKAYRAVVERSIRSSHQGHKHKVMTHARHKMGIEDTKWSQDQKITMIGKPLIDMFCKASGLMFIEHYNKPKQYSKKLKRMVKNTGVTLKPTTKTLQWLDENHAICEVLAPVLKPMVVKPKPWTSPFDGGFVAGKFAKNYNSCRFIRGVREDWLIENTNAIGPEVIKAVNAVQETPYRVNKRVFATMKELGMKGKAGLPESKMPELRIPPTPWGEMTDDAFAEYRLNNLEEVRKWCADAHKIHQEYADEMSKRTSYLEKVRLADMFKDYDKIYFPVNLDWRGRTYCMSTPFLTPQGDDAAKGCLEFAEGKVVTLEGIKELKIHGANCAGKDKLTEYERVRWVDTNEDFIKHVANEPFGEAQMEFWTNAEKPFQFLAFCFDIVAYWADPENHKSNLICHIDQTCSGLQHWSAVLRDGDGAAQVGCVDKPEPDDIYQAVADEVERLIADTDDPILQAWQGKVTRKITKRNVMTKLYGATMPGMRDQVHKELASFDKKAEGDRYLEGCPVDNFKAADAIAKMNNLAMTNLVAKATAGMDYTQKMARLLAVEGLPVRWTSPIGLPIEQTYWRTMTKRVYTYWVSVDIKKHVARQHRGEVKLNVSFAAPERGIQVKKAENSIAPNFIHSMDASHLLFIALNYKGALTTVHDSFGTHASDIPELHKVVRREFVNMYDNEDHLKDFSMGLSDYYAPAGFILRPELGQMDFNKILTATYFCR